MIKVKKNGLMLLIGLLLTVIACLLFMGTAGKSTAYAAVYDGAEKYKLNVASSGADGVYLQCDSSSSTEVTIDNGAMFKSAPTSLSVILQAKSKLGRYTYTKYVKNVELTGPVTYSNTKRVSNTSSISKKTVTYDLPALTEGIYTLKLTTGKDYSGVVGDTSSKIEFTFYYDKTCPTISGASVSSTGKYTNQTFTVTASDSVSGVENLYMMSPNSSSYTAVGSASKTVAASSTSGLYKFYAKDNAANNTATHYVYLDTVVPTMSLKTSSGSSISGTNVNTAFSCVGSDAHSGLSYMQYKSPSMSSWANYTSGTVIAKTVENGIYQFRAVDRTGNTSETLSVNFDTIKPTGVLYGGSTVIANGGATNADYVSFVASDNFSGVKNIYIKVPNSNSYVNYTSGNRYTESGKYSFYCTDAVGNSSITYTITLDKDLPVLSCAQTDFYTTTEYDFTVSATDKTSGVTLYYKTPLMTDFAVAAGGNYSVKTTDSDGKYYFYGKDAVGNVSETRWIELNVSVPTATIERDETTNHHRITWDGNGTGRLNDNPYTKGEWITTEGEYTFVITNTSNRSNTYHFTIAHAFVAVATKEPTCTNQGFTRYECLTCSVSYIADYVEAKGHSFDDGQLIGETCAEGAYYLYTCMDCGYMEKSEYITQGGHKYDKTVVKSTCTDRGYTIYKCTVCAWTFHDDYTAALGHNYRSTVVEPTCTEGGHTEFECKVCFDSYISDYTQAVGHIYEEEAVEANCTDKGFVLHKCVNCDDEYRTDETYALGHHYVETTREVTCEQNGCILHTCTRCGYEYQTNITQALGHKYVTEMQLPSTCTEAGRRHYTCSRCGGFYDSEIPAIGHSYEITETTSKGGTTVRTYTCTLCGHSYVQDLGDQYGEVSNYVEYLFQQYSPYMFWVFLATAGVWSIAMGIAIIVAHKNEDKQKAKKMLVNYIVGLVIIFAILVATPYLVRGIAALVAG